MIRDITLGQFFPGKSILHKLDPRMKIILVSLYITALFLASSSFSYLFIIFITISLMFISEISIKLYLRGLKPLIFIMTFTGILNIFYSTGDPLFRIWIFTVTKEGIYSAAFMIIRILLLVISTSMLTYTTSPIVLTSGLERLLSPLKAIKVPVHEFSMMMTIALRFIPTLLEETEKIMNAQKARGADFETGSIIKRAKALVPILIPLFVSAFRRADELAIAMECRCYNGDSKGRTRLIQYHLEQRDYLSLITVIIIMAAVIFLNNYNF